MLAGVKATSTGTIFVSVPRWKPGVPATLATLDFSAPGATPTTPLLRPFPSWEGNAVGDASALQSVLGFEIDSCDRVWVLDQGRVAGEPAIPGSIKLVVYNSTTGAELWRRTFSEDLASADRSFLNDLVLDQVNQFAFITDSGIPINASLPDKGGLLIYNYQADEGHQGEGVGPVRRVIDSTWATQPNTSLWIHINGDPVLQASPEMTGADGIALSPDVNTLVTCPLTSHHNFAIPTAVLRDPTSTDAQILAATVDLGSKGTASDGLAFDSTGALYNTGLELNGVFRQSHVAPGQGPGDSLAMNATTLVWPDTIGFDHHGSILLVTNQLYKFVEGRLDFSGAVNNFRLSRIAVGPMIDSYMAASARKALARCFPQA